MKSHTKTFDKLFSYEVILDRRSCLNRIALIERLTAAIGKPTYFLVMSNGILRKSTYLGDQYKNLTKRFLTIDLYYKLALLLDYFHDGNLYHGDLHPKNILTDGNGVEIVDWEPCPQQIYNGIISMKCTYPYIHPKDHADRNFTKLTDYLCLISLWLDHDVETCLSILNQWLDNNNDAITAIGLATHIYNISPHHS